MPFRFVQIQPKNPDFLAGWQLKIKQIRMFYDEMLDLRFLDITSRSSCAFALAFLFLPC